MTGCGRDDTTEYAEKLMGSLQGWKVYVVSATTGGLLLASTTPVQKKEVHSELMVHLSPAFSTLRPDIRVLMAAQVTGDCC